MPPSCSRACGYLRSATRARKFGGQSRRRTGAGGCTPAVPTKPAGSAEPTLNCAISYDRSAARRENQAGPTASAGLLVANKRSSTGQSRGSRVTMGNMSASDAAPLPRLGEVYFDVRGESRSMRLSWYADTGVAVFSIWQGGTCTGTFRLPIADLPRMIDALQRGPQGDAADPAGPPDAPRGATEPHDRPAQRGRTGPHERPGHGPEDYGPGADSGPGTGYADPGLPATGAHREADSGEYGRTGAHGRYEPEATAAYSGDSVPGGQGGYRGERADSYADEPTGVYRGDLPGEDYREDPGAGYRDGGQRPDRRGSGHQGDPLSGGHQDDPLSGGYREDPLSGRYREDPLGGHPGDRRTSGYREDPPGG